MATELNLPKSTICDVISLHTNTQGQSRGRPVKTTISKETCKGFRRVKSLQNGPIKQD